MCCGKVNILAEGLRDLITCSRLRIRCPTRHEDHDTLSWLRVRRSRSCPRRFCTSQRRLGYVLLAHETFRRIEVGFGKREQNLVQCAPTVVL